MASQPKVEAAAFAFPIVDETVCVLFALCFSAPELSLLTQSASRLINAESIDGFTHTHTGTSRGIASVKVARQSTFDRCWITMEGGAYV